MSEDQLDLWPTCQKCGTELELTRVHTCLKCDPAITPQARRDDGMRRAEEHADRVTHAWSALAYQMLHHFLDMNPVAAKTGFLTEFYLEFANLHGLPEPPDRRAFGAVMNRAARNGLIVKSGYAEDRFCSPKTVWRRA